MTRSVADVFLAAREQGRSALIGYLPAGFPTAADSVELICAMVDAGVDLVEVGLPYSDPVMDGVDIQAAVDQALRGGTTTDVVIDTVARLSDAGVSAVVMSYWNPIERYGVDRFADRLAAAGGLGVITPDLTPEESGPWLAACEKSEIDHIFLVAPSSTDPRIQTVTSVSSGFVYAASTMGVTGVRTSVSTSAPALVARARVITDLPIGVGVGVSNGEQARQVAEYADGVIVGTALVRGILHAADRAEALDRTRALAAELAEGVKGTRPAVDSSLGATT